MRFTNATGLLLAIATHQYFSHAGELENADLEKEMLEAMNALAIAEQDPSKLPNAMKELADVAEVYQTIDPANIKDPLMRAMSKETKEAMAAIREYDENPTPENEAKLTDEVKDVIVAMAGMQEEELKRQLDMTTDPITKDKLSKLRGHISELTEMAQVGISGSDEDTAQMIDKMIEIVKSASSMVGKDGAEINGGMLNLLMSTIVGDVSDASTAGNPVGVAMSALLKALTEDRPYGQERHDLLKAIKNLSG